MMQPLKQKIEDKKFKVKELEEMSLETDNNKGVFALSKYECEKRFIEIIELNAEIEILELEYESKMQSFKHYFGKQKEEKVKDND